MATKTCSKGHIYDSSLGNCPICGSGASNQWGGSGSVDDIPATSPVPNWGGGSQDWGGGAQNFGGGSQNWGGGSQDWGGNVQNIGETVPSFDPRGGGSSFDVGVTTPVTNPGFEGGFSRGAVEEYEPTAPVNISGANGFDPVVGWLICIEGPNRGKDYRLHSGTNFIGRGKEMDVCIENDQTISKVKAAAISYDDRSGSFFIEKGNVRNLMYLNGKPLLSVMDLAIYDRIEIGNTKLVFIPLCGPDFSWQDM